MPNQTPAEQDETLITLEGDDGHSYSCQLIDVFEFEKQEYALLVKNPDAQGTENKKAKPGEPEEGSLVVMRLLQRDDQCIFQTIEDDQEFEKVISYIEELAQQSLDETTNQIAQSEQK
jgi:hypothetical protein